MQAHGVPDDYSDWNTYARGDSTRLTRLNLRISYLQAKINSGNFSTEGKSHEFDVIQKELADLRKIEKEEANIASAGSSGRRATFTRGRVL